MGQMIAFYSPRARVGSTMALANVGVLLAKWQFKVLLVDWDLESPQLPDYFEHFMGQRTVAQCKGIADLLGYVPDAASQLTEPANWQEYVIAIELPPPMRPRPGISPAS